ncbi:MAG: hypothetical protein P1V97_25810 [Planctomycetota bacterium]|nr:hypothetical protein [Planctomycetota bacterium]
MLKKITVSLIVLITPIAAFGQSEKPKKAQKKLVTFSEHIAPIIYQNCTSCHRKGQGAPFKLETYRDVRKRGQMIQHVVESRIMPPWHPSDGHGEFAGRRRMDPKDIQTLSDWVDSGMKRGDAKKAPALPHFPTGWSLGKPDLVVTMEKGFKIPAAGPDIYRNFVIPLNLKKDYWVKAVALRPSSPSVVHHVLFFLDESGKARKLDGASGQPGFSGMGFKRSGSLGGWAVGATPKKLPFDLARPLKQGSDLVIQSHFHPSGKVETEKTTIALYFAKKKPTRSLMNFQVPPLFGRFAGIDVPAGEKNFVIKDSFKVPVDIDLITVGAHAHYIARSMKAWAVLPNKTIKKLFYIGQWDFNWQEIYHYKTPTRVPAGSVIHVKLVYDNSADNPNNPFSPPRRIGWGLESTDEMGSVLFNAIPVRESEKAIFEKSARSQFFKGKGGQRLFQMLQQLKQFDLNKDGKVSRDELPKMYHGAIERLDNNNDGALDLVEIDSLGQKSAPSRTPKKVDEKKPAKNAKKKYYFSLIVDSSPEAPPCSKMSSSFSHSLFSRGAVLATAMTECKIVGERCRPEHLKTE